MHQHTWPVFTLMLFILWKRNTHLFRTLSTADARDAAPPMWKVRIVSCVPGSPIDCAATTPTASPMLTVTTSQSHGRNSCAHTVLSFTLITERTIIVHTCSFNGTNTMLINQEHSFNNDSPSSRQYVLSNDTPSTR